MICPKTRLHLLLMYSTFELSLFCFWNYSLFDESLFPRFNPQFMDVMTFFKMLPSDEIAILILERLLMKNALRASFVMRQGSSVANFSHCKMNKSVFNVFIFAGKFTTKQLKCVNIRSSTIGSCRRNFQTSISSLFQIFFYQHYLFFSFHLSTKKYSTRHFQEPVSPTKRKTSAPVASLFK